MRDRPLAPTHRGAARRARSTRDASGRPTITAGAALAEDAPATTDDADGSGPSRRAGIRARSEYMSGRRGRPTGIVVVADRLRNASANSVRARQQLDLEPPRSPPTTTVA